MNLNRRFEKVTYPIWIQFIFLQISDHEGQAWFVAFALFLETELREQLESSLMYREYIFSSVSSADFTNDSIARLVDCLHFLYIPRHSSSTGGREVLL